MNRLMPSAAPEIDSMAREAPTRSAPAMVYALLANSSANPSGLDDWLGEIAKALRARLAALVAIWHDELLAEHFFPAEAGLLKTGNWPWQPDRRSIQQFRDASPAVPLLSSDGHSSFLSAAVRHEGVLWVLCLEDVHSRIWSVDEQAALTLAAASLFQFASIQEKARIWCAWSGRAQTQQRLEDVAVAVARLVHDLNNILTTVQGFTELCLTQLPSSAPQRNFMTEVYTAAQQAARLMHQLSVFSTRKVAPQGLTASLSLLLADEAKALRKAWGDGVALEVLVPADLAELSIDVDSLRVLLDKLLTNAREAISSTGTVILSARHVELTREDCLGLFGKACPGSFVEITVADSGHGFSPEARRRIFAEPFYSTKPGQRGLGLLAVYGILHNHGGGIRLEHGSESGTLVRVYLPARRRATKAREGDKSAGDGVLSSSQLCLATQGETRGKSSNR